jgi:hypothetical protein
MSQDVKNDAGSIVSVEMTEQKAATADAIGSDPSLLIVEDDAPFLKRLARAMETRGFPNMPWWTSGWATEAAST